MAAPPCLSLALAIPARNGIIRWDVLRYNGRGGWWASTTKSNRGANVGSIPSRYSALHAQIARIIGGISDPKKGFYSPGGDYRGCLTQRLSALSTAPLCEGLAWGHWFGSARISPTKTLRRSTAGVAVAPAGVGR